MRGSILGGSLSGRKSVTFDLPTASHSLSKRSRNEPQIPNKDDTSEAPPMYHVALFMRTLRIAFGHKILVHIFASIHLLKGFIKTMCESPIPWILGAKNVSGPRLQVLNQFIHMPFALKPVLGLMSDFMPLFGYHKMPYAVLATLGLLASLIILGFVDHAVLSANVLAGCFFTIWLGISMNDLLIQAKYSEKINTVPTLGPSLVSFIWFGTYAFQMIGVLMVGFMMQYMGNGFPYVVCIPAAYFLLLPTLYNYMEETKSTPEQMATRRREIRDHYYVVVLVGVLLFCNVVFHADNC